jgi:hypothetical protein
MDGQHIRPFGLSLFPRGASSGFLSYSCNRASTTALSVRSSPLHVTQEQARLGMPANGQKSKIGQNARQNEQQRMHHGVVSKPPLARARRLYGLVFRELRRYSTNGLAGTRTQNQRLKRAVICLCNKLIDRHLR